MLAQSSTKRHDQPTGLPTRSIKRVKVSAQALKYFFLSSLVLLAFALLIDRVVLPCLEDEGKIASRSWRLENVRIWQEMSKRNGAHKDWPVWHSNLFKVKEQKSKAKRILVMGDSFVWGDGYSNMNTIWWRQLERELDLKGYDVEVIAAGMCGDQTFEQLQAARKLIPAYNPDLVIWGYVTNDPLMRYQDGTMRVQIYDRPERRSIRDVKEVFLHLFPNLTDALFELRNNNRRKLLSNPKDGFEYAEWELRMLEGENWQLYRRTVSELAAFISESKVPQFFLTLPNGFSMRSITEANNKDRALYFDSMKVYYRVRYKPVKELFAANGLPFFDTLDEFISQARQDPIISKSDSPLRVGINPCNAHPGAFATHFFAVEAVKIMERDYAAFLGPRTAARRDEKRFVINDCVPGTIELTARGPASYTFVYPDDKETMLKMPMRRPTVTLNLQSPIRLDQIAIKSETMEKGACYVTLLDSNLGYDTGKPLLLGEKKGNHLVFELPPELRSSAVNTIRLALEVKGRDKLVSVAVR